ncbi:MAG TPA: helicase-related protein, partial [Novosphingobium sp.]|nr:helicase-related protein [Novosphingobium sp.]
MGYDQHAGLRPHGSAADATVKAVLGPTNTGKTHLAIERLCAHSSGAIGFPLRLLAREVYDRVCAIKGANRVALITGEERIEPRDARYLLCTAEAMPVAKDLSFVALDEAQLAADRERGHVFTDRLLHARGRDETMILGSQTLEPMVKALIPKAEIIGRPRFSTLTHAGARKLSRIPPRSAIVAFSAEQVYAIAEMLRRFRGGAAVVMGALSPQTRNAQVALYQSGEVDYLVATDAVGMGLNLDVGHVAFAGLSKFDGMRQRRLTPAEMAQIAGRAGRHQRDGTFGTLGGTGAHDAAFTDEEVYAIEEHRFAPLTHLYWRDAEPRLDTLAVLIGDLEAPPQRPELIRPPEAIDLTVLKRLAEDPQIAATVRSSHDVARFWEACRLPDFRQHGPDAHARFVARLWQDLRSGMLGTDYVAQAIAQLDNVSGDIDTLQGRIAAIRSWAYITQRPDWVMAQDEMAARARAVEARLSDALHARLTERFINRRTAVLMKTAGRSPDLLTTGLEGDDVMVEGERIGTLTGFSFEVDPDVPHADRKLLLAAAERHLPRLLEQRAAELAGAVSAGEFPLLLDRGRILWRGKPLARLIVSKDPLSPEVAIERSLGTLTGKARETLGAILADWLATMLRPLEPVRRIHAASRLADAGPELRALLIRLAEAGGMIDREGSGLEGLDRTQRARLAKLGVKVGALDLYLPEMLGPAALAAWAGLAQLGGRGTQLPGPAMPPAIDAGKGPPPSGYRAIGKQAVRLDIAEKLVREAHDRRMIARGRTFALDPRRAISMGLTGASYARLLRLAGFRSVEPRALAQGALGPPAP